MKQFTNKQLKLIHYCITSEYFNGMDDPWYLWHQLGFGDREEFPEGKERDEKDEQAFKMLSELADSILLMIE
jgi:hypothetical protein